MFKPDPIASLLNFFFDFPTTPANLAERSIEQESQKRDSRKAVGSTLNRGYMKIGQKRPNRTLKRGFFICQQHFSIVFSRS